MTLSQLGLRSFRIEIIIYLYSYRLLVIQRISEAKLEIGPLVS